MGTDGKLNISLPKFDYMSQNNTYSGSCGSFRYKFFPLKKDEIDTVFVAAVYYSNCYEVELENGRVVSEEFDYSNDGIAAAEKWIESKYSQEQDTE